MIYSSLQSAFLECQKGGNFPTIVYEITYDGMTEFTPQEINAHNAALRVGDYKDVQDVVIRTHTSVR